MKRILITGATGLVGDGICRYFLENNWQVFGTSRKKLNSFNPMFTPIKLNVNSKTNISILNDYLPFDAIVHSAAKLPYTLKDDNDINKYYNCNVDGTRFLLDWSIVSKIRRFIYISSTGVMDSKNTYFGESSAITPKLNHYHTSKAMGELLCGLYNNSNLNDIIIEIITGTIDTNKINMNVGVKVI